MVNPEGFEPTTFGTGIQRAAVAPWVRDHSIPRELLKTNQTCVPLNRLTTHEFTAKKVEIHFSICACHPCAGAMLIFSVSFQF